jgi:DNA-binding XRE family transcriptional regulator
MRGKATELDKKIAKRLRDLRRKSEIPQKLMAEWAGVRPPTWYQVERGYVRLSLSQFIRIVEKLEENSGQGLRPGEVLQKILDDIADGNLLSDPSTPISAQVKELEVCYAADIAHPTEPGSA